jgi:DNA-binding NtrC family response regulator
MSAMLHEFLTAYGAHVVSFSDPILALEAYTQNAGGIELVITDETMPGLSGMHLAESMLKIKPALPIILCTGFSEHANPESAAKIGIAGFFHKPLKMNELLRKIAELLPVKNG